MTIWRDLIVNLIYSFTGVFLVTCVLLGFDFHTAFLILLCVFMIIIDMFGVMYLWHIELNAVSVVNIVMVRFFDTLTSELIVLLCSRLVLQLNSVLTLHVILPFNRVRLD